MSDTEYLTLKEITEQAEINFGQNLIPISAFGYTYQKLEKILNEAVRDFEEYYPLEKEETFQLSTAGVKIPDAIAIVEVRYAYGDFRKITPKIEKRNLKWYDHTKTLRCNVSLTALVVYGAHYPVDYLFIADQAIVPIYATEDDVTTLVKGHFKKGTLKYSLDEGIIPESAFTVNVTTNEITINALTGSYFYTGTIISVRTTNTLPSPLLINTDYYVIKISDTIIKLAPTRDDAFANTNIIDVTTLGTGIHYLNKVLFTLSEDLTTYTEYKSTFTVNVTDNTLENLDNLFVNRLVEDSTITLTTTVTLPSPLTINTSYFIIPVNATTIKLATTLENALLGTAIDITSVGTGIHTIHTPIVLPNELNKDDFYIHLYGTLGKAEVNLFNLTGTFYNIYDLTGTLTHTFASRYKAVEGISLHHHHSSFFTAFFKQKFLDGLGRQKMTTKLEGLPVDITADQILEAANELKQELQQLKESRGKWWWAIS